MTKLLKITVSLFMGLIIVGCGGGSTDTLERVTLTDANYRDAVKAMVTVNEYLIGNMEAIGLILGIIRDDSCTTGTIVHSGTSYTFNDCVKEGGRINGTLDYSYIGDQLALTRMNLTLSATDGSTELSYTDSSYRITFVAGSDDSMAKIDIHRTGYFKKAGALAIQYYQYALLFDKSSGTGTKESYNGSFILPVYSDKALTIQTDHTLTLSTGDGCPSSGTIQIMGEDSTLTMEMQSDFSIKLTLDGDIKPPLADCDTIVIYTL